MGSGYDIILSVQLTRNKTLSIGQESREGRYVRGGRMVSDFTCPSEIRCFYPSLILRNLPNNTRMKSAETRSPQRKCLTLSLGPAYTGTCQKKFKEKAGVFLY